jgi:hypothetical protein
MSVMISSAKTVKWQYRGGKRAHGPRLRRIGKPTEKFTRWRSRVGLRLRSWAEHRCGKPVLASAKASSL